MSRFALKGQRHEIFDFRFSTWISFPQAPDYTIRAVSNFSQKFAEIFAAQDAPPVSLTSVANRKNLKSEKFSLFLLDLVSRVNIKINFFLQVHFKLSGV